MYIPTCVSTQAAYACVQPFVQHACTVSETRKCSITRNRTHVCSHVWTFLYIRVCVKLHLSSTVSICFRLHISQQLTIKVELKVLYFLASTGRLYGTCIPTFELLKALKALGTKPAPFPCLCGLLVPFHAFT